MQIEIHDAISLNVSTSDARHGAWVELTIVDKNGAKHAITLHAMRDDAIALSIGPR